MHGTDRTLRPELGQGGKQTHRDVYDPATGGTKRVPVDQPTQVGVAETPSTVGVAYPGAPVIDLPAEHAADEAQ